MEHRQGGFPKFLVNRLQSCDDVCQKARWIVVAFVQRKPGDRPPAAGGPLAQQCGLAKAGWGGDEGELALQPCIQLFNQARARHQLWPEGGDIEFGGQQGCGHFALPDSIWRPTSPLKQDFWIPQSYHILPIVAKLLT